MQTYNLTLEDTIADKVLAFLNGFSSSEVQLKKVEESDDDIVITRIEDLYGVLAPYTNGYLSDDDIENAISEGAIDSGMAGKSI